MVDLTILYIPNVPNLTDQHILDLPSETKVQQVKLLVTPHDILHSSDWRDFCNGVEASFTKTHSMRTFEAMWTHFAVELLFEGDITAKLEKHGVRLTQRCLFEKEFQLGLSHHPSRSQ